MSLERIDTELARDAGRAVHRPPDLWARRTSVVCDRVRMHVTMRALSVSLTAQRSHVLGILDGLDEDALRMPVLPSGWSCAGLVQHLAVDVERFWFRAVMAGEQAAWDSFGEESAWALDADTTGSAVLALYRQEIAGSDRVISSLPGDAAPASWPEELFGDFRLHDLHEVVLHVLTETACHAGHLDAARELIDGRTWLVL